MKAYLGILVRAVIITIVAAAIGVGVNFLSPKGIPLVYTPRAEVVVASGRKIPIIDEKKASEYLEAGETVFVDARPREEFDEGHVKDAVSLPAEAKEERYVEVQPLLLLDSKIIVYCSGPECRDAETVAKFLDQLGYEKLAVMGSGYFAWKKAGYPVEGE